MRFGFKPLGIIYIYKEKLTQMNRNLRRKKELYLLSTKSKRQKLVAILKVTVMNKIV